QVIAKISEPTEGALALASGHADWFMAKSRVVTARDNTSFCRLAAAMARIQAKVARTQTGFAGYKRCQPGKRRRWRGSKAIGRGSKLKLPANPLRGPISIRFVRG